MSRVSENSASSSLKFSLNKAKKKMEDLQMKGTSLKKIVRPSDDPVGNIESLGISSNLSNLKQYGRNINHALTQLSSTDKSLESLVDIVGKAKEIAISQSSDFYSSGIRKNIANEVRQLRNQALGISNTRLGQKYIFAGYKSLERPFSADGKYLGDKGYTNIEVAKDFFLPINLHGSEIFFGKSEDSIPGLNDGDEKKSLFPKQENGKRELASIQNSTDQGYYKYANLFAQLDALATGLENDDAILIQGLLEKFDESSERLVGLRTKVGSLINSIEAYENLHRAEDINLQAKRSKIQDADIGELFSDITKQQNILKATYQSSQSMLNQNLLDFIR